MTLRRTLLTLFLSAFAAAGAAFSQEVQFESQAIVVNPSPSFGVTVWLDKDGETPQYRVGEEIRINVRVDEDAFVYLYDLQPDGTVTQILPNRFTDANRLSAGETRAFPPQDAGYVFNVDPPEGLSKVVAVASKRRLDTEQLARFQEGQAFAQSDIGQEGFQEAFRIVVNPVPQNQWVTATAYYETVGGRGGREQPSEARLRVTSDPSGATVFLDGRRQGTTPLRLTRQPGRTDLEIRRDGYETYQERLQLRPGQSYTVDADLQRARRTGMIRFQSEPSGADVYLDGRFLGTTPVGARELDTGNYEVRFSRSGYADTTVDLTVRAGDDRTVRAELRPQQGRLRFQGNVGGAAVYLDGRRAGEISNGSGTLTVEELDPGRYQVTVVAPGYGTHVEEVRVEAGETRSYSFRQSRR